MNGIGLGRRLLWQTAQVRYELVGFWCMPLDLPDLFCGETHPLPKVAASIVERRYHPTSFPRTQTDAAGWRYRLGVVMADQLVRDGRSQEAYTSRLHATEIESWTAALYNAWPHVKGDVTAEVLEVAVLASGP